MIHNIVDTDTHFIIDSSTRLVKNETETKSMLVQYDHNSEKFTFRVPRKIDEHDLTNCNVVRVHFINLDKSKRPAYEGVDDITESLGECEEDDECATCSWLVPDRATQVAGFLHFVIQFACVDKKTNEVLYSWNTAKYTGITIADGIKNDDSYITQNTDILTEWENKLKATQVVSTEQTTTSTDDEGENVWTVTFADGSEKPFVVRNGSKGEKGDTGLVGSIETINGSPLHFFVGNREEYEALSDEQKQNLFAVIGDDTTEEAIVTMLNAIHDWQTKVESGEKYVKHAQFASYLIDSPNNDVSLKSFFGISGKAWNPEQEYVNPLEIESNWGLPEEQEKAEKEIILNSMFPTGTYLLHIIYGDSTSNDRKNYTALGYIDWNLLYKTEIHFNYFNFGAIGDAVLSISFDGVKFNFPKLDDTSVVRNIYFERVSGSL